MSRPFLITGRRNRFAVTVLAGAIAILLPAVVVHAQMNSPERSAVQVAQASTKGASDVQPAVDETIRPFQFHATDEALVDLQRRVNATRWPSQELVGDDTQGVRLSMMQKLAEYWAKEYDWRKVEAKLNGLPQFVTNIDGVDIHFIHGKSKHPNALPVIVTHGWPGSIIEQLKIIDPLTNPTAHGASASDAFDVVIPSIPGYGFSGKPTELGWDPQRVARAWAALMDRLDYKKYVAHGGDWG